MQKNALSPQKFWFLDWFGHLIDYDFDRSCLCRRPLSQNYQPNLYAILPPNISLPARILLNTPSGTPDNVPDIRIEDAGKRRVALRESTGNLQYLTINPANDGAFFATIFLYDCERFLPLDLSALRGLSSFLFNKNLEIIDLGINQPVTPIFDFHNGDLGRVNGKPFYISQNVKIFRKIDQLLLNQPKKLSFKGSSKNIELILTKRSEQPI